MSYDIYLESDKCEACGRAGEEPDLPNPTYNLTPIFDLAITGEGLPNADVNEFQVVILRKETDRPRGLRVLNGHTGTTAGPLLEKALERMHDPMLRPRFLELQPDNGWGDLPGAIWVVEQLIEAAKRYPKNKWRVQ